MKKQLLLLTLGALFASPFINAAQKTMQRGSFKKLLGSEKQEYRATFDIINKNVQNLTSAEKQGLVNSLLAYFNGKAGLTRLNPQQQEIYASATKTFDNIKKLEAKRKTTKQSNLLGTEGRNKMHHRNYSPSRHFAQKVIGTIYYPNPEASLPLSSPIMKVNKSWSGTKPVGPERKPIRTTPVGPEKRKGPMETIGTSGIRRNVGPQSGTTRAGITR